MGKWIGWLGKARHIMRGGVRCALDVFPKPSEAIHPQYNSWLHGTGFCEYYRNPGHYNHNT